MNRREEVSTFVLIPQYFGSLLFDRRNSQYFPFDHQTSEIFRLLIERSPGEFFRSHQSTADRESLIKFYQYFYSQGFFSIDGNFLGRILDVQTIPEDHLLGPLAVHLEVTTECNLDCLHCYAGANRDTGNSLTICEMDQLFSELATMGSFRLGLTGGEPLLNPELFDIIDCAHHHGLHPCLTTNGLFITEEIAKKFGQRDLLWLNVSLEGAHSQSNDRIRGSGTFEQVLNNIKILRKHSKFALSFTITSQSGEGVEECAKLARKLGAAAAVFRPLYPVGNAGESLDLMPTYSQYSQAIQKLEKCADIIQTIDPFGPLLRQGSRANIGLNQSCGAGTTVASISVQGDVNPCSFLGTEFNSGNIRERPFSEIWHQGKTFRTLRNGSKRPGFCAGCRARAHALNGSPFASDPWHDQWLTTLENFGGPS